MSSGGPNVERSISPPPKRRRTLPNSAEENTAMPQDPNAEHQDGLPSSTKSHETKSAQEPSGLYTPAARMVPSPVRLNFVEELTASSNIDTVSLGNILGDVMIRECWLFNYLFDLDFIMSKFDPDIRHIVKVHIIHGSWRKEDQNKIAIDEAATRYKNVDVITAYMPEPFGTHHSKMIVLFRHDDLAQIVILTANFIERDWCMSQAIWQSPLLPLNNGPHIIEDAATYPPGSGPRFKSDLKAYLKCYGAKLKDLITEVDAFDFSGVKAALIASTPGRQNVYSTDPETETLWGWPGLRRILGTITTQRGSSGPNEASPENDPQSQRSHIAVQVSSIASFGTKWLTSVLFSALSVSKRTILQPPGGSAGQHPRFSVVFPTAETIRKSVNGYGSGSSIHMKIQSPTQAKQLSEIRPMLCHWAGNAADPNLGQMTGRGRAAPHVKTYVRFSDSSMEQIDWAMVTSANLSTQAWGAARSASGEVRICSYEIGVIVWPDLWKDVDHDGSNVRMVPVFGKDTPLVNNVDSGKEEKETVVGWRMPYDLPLVPYEKDEMPWCASEPDSEPDWLGQIWPGYHR